MARKNAAEVQDTDSNEVFYVTKEKEVATFSILVQGVNIPGIWDDARERLVFTVPAELEERFKTHHHVVTGRVVPK